MQAALARSGIDDWSRDGHFILYHDATNHMYARDVTLRSATPNDTEGGRGAKFCAPAQARDGSSVTTIDLDAG